MYCAIFVSDFFHNLTVALPHTRRRWAFVRGLLAAGWRQCCVLNSYFFYFFFTLFF
jgi:hypothetical protein